ncbi:thiol-disulfide isomerase/thioredoxin [Tenacibaculum lutimaris]|uniref:Thiol-disulfide isomerase/thioredoxin n=1 Tax=Tenacibaculum lutimaris TaxID=285258 RepID=A0A420E4P6_9FLAO|nr:TlpA disulfide reductase family protein [Tenacibaculum lutimaris]RKF04847.1 thiol-disulfide isomerase/thioredoxin [Tenacibaculum lutimaris]
MKKEVLFIFLYIFSLQVTSQQLTFELEENPSTIKYNVNKEDIEIHLNEKGIINFKISKPQFFGISTENYRVIYLEPLFDLRIKGKSLNDSISFEGIGAIENNYLISKRKIIDSLNKELDFFTLKSLSKDDFYTRILKFRNLFFENLNNFSFDSKIFKTLETKSINLEIARRVLFYQGRKKEVSKEILEKFPIEITNPFYKINLNDTEALALEDFRYEDFLSKYFDRKVKKYYHQGLGTDYNQEVQSYASKNISDEQVLNSFLFSYSWQLIKYLPKKDVYFDTFINLSKNENHKKIISKLYLSFSEVSKGKQSPDFMLTDNQGNILSLKNFKGKITYIDIWATWCKPCLADYPKMEELHKKYGDQINIVSIGYLDSKDRWSEFIEAHKPKWTQLFFLPKSQEFFDKYTVTGVPRYILLDSEGKIISASAPPPSSIEKTLKERL